MSKRSTITTSIFYRWRYWIGYGAIIILLAGLLFVAGFIVPGAVSTGELQSIITTSSFDIHDITVDLPFHYLQHLTLTFFGATLIGIKLPSLVLGFVTAICMTLLLRRWFTPGVAVLASMLVIATGQFLYLTQNGTPSILYLFWPTVLLLLGTLVANRARWHGLWNLLFFIVAALSLYTPFSLYVLVAMGVAVLLHPHLRHVIRHVSKLRIAGGLIVFIAIIAPLVLSIISSPELGLRLLGIPLEWPDMWANAQILFSQYLGFMDLGTSSTLLPIFGLPSMLLILYGFVRLIKKRTATQSHLILSWIILLFPILMINPLSASILFVPQFLLLASGLEGVLRRWYKLFPLNPYARIAGLLPIIILVSSMVLAGFERYTYAYRYAPDIVHNFTRDVVIIPDKEQLVVTQDEYELYHALAQYKPSFRVSTQEQVQLDPSRLESGYAVTAAAYDPTMTPTSVVVSNRHEDSARFYIYNPSDNGILRRE